MIDKEQSPVPPGPPDRAGVIALPPLIVLAFLVPGVLLHVIWPLRFLDSTLARWTGVALIAVAIAVAASAVRQLAKARTALDVRKPTTAIVTGGVYGFSRNPIYLGMMLGFLGIASLLASPWLLILVVPLFAVLQKGVIEREERYLEAKFGEPYRDYKSRVRRWI